MPMACTLTPRTKAQNGKPTITQPTSSSFPQTRESTNLGMDSGSPPHSTRNDGAGFRGMSKAQGIGVSPVTALIPSRRSYKNTKPTRPPPTPSSFPRTRESINLGMDSGSPPGMTISRSLVSFTRSKTFSSPARTLAYTKQPLHRITPPRRRRSPPARRSPSSRWSGRPRRTC